MKTQKLTLKETKLLIKTFTKILARIEIGQGLNGEFYICNIIIAIIKDIKEKQFVFDYFISQRPSNKQYYEAFTSHNFLHQYDDNNSTKIHNTAPYWNGQNSSARIDYLNAIILKLKKQLK